MNYAPNLGDIRARLLAEKDRRKRLEDRKAACEDNLQSFIKLLWPVVEPVTPLVWGWTLDLLCDALTAVTDGHINRLIINVPPGFSKSYCLNVFWPAWEWGPQGMPHLRYLSAAYQSGLAERDNGGDVGRFSRVIASSNYRLLWGDRFSIVKDNAGLVENNKTGSKRVVTPGGGTTGYRGDRICIDDANNPQDVESETVRDTTNTWLREVMPSRTNDAEKSAIINVQQRTHEEDATGTLAKYGDGYDWVCVPMHFDPMRIFPVTLSYDDEGEPDRVWVDPRSLDADGNQLDGLFTDARGKMQLRPGSPMAQAEGALAWPERFSAEWCDKQRNILGSYAYEGQYQQNPGVRGGEIIRRDWWQPWTAATYPDFGTCIASLDTALEEGEKNDWNALTTWGAFPGQEGQPHLMMTAAARWRCKLAELIKNVHEVCVRHKVDYLLIEKKTRGRDVHDEIRRLYANAPFQTILVEPKGTKVSRLNAVSHLFSGDMRRDPTTGIDVYSGGCIFAPDREWADAVIDEVTSFPRGAHDDYVDTVSQVLGWVRRTGVVLRRVEWEDQEEDRKRHRRSPKVPYAVRKNRD